MNIIEIAFKAGRSKQTWRDFQMENVTAFTRDELVSLYVHLIRHKASDEVIKKVNDSILTKWSNSGLNYIKEKAWKIYDPDGKKFLCE